jgi:hypothetical protein
MVEKNISPDNQSRDYLCLMNEMVMATVKSLALLDLWSLEGKRRSFVAKTDAGHNIS